MRITDTVVIGAGQAGLAASRCLADRGRAHVVLERGVLDTTIDQMPDRLLARHEPSVQLVGRPDQR